MCGRFILISDLSVITEIFGIQEVTCDYRPSSNVLPSHTIAANGFYESMKEGKKKIPFYFRLKSGKPFGFAGLYETWTSPEGQSIHTCTIITTEPNDVIQPIHNRMPVIVPREKETSWIDPAVQDHTSISAVLRPYPSSEMEAFPLSSPKDLPIGYMAV
jgi:putative SOS response-associated peptidase YedK